MLGLMSLAIILATLVLASCAEEATAPPPVESPTPETTVASPEASPSPEPPAGGECVDATASGRPEATIRLHDDEFVPACLTVLGGQGLKLTNHGSALHNFSVEGSDVAIDVGPGETVRTEAIGGAVPAGTHSFFDPLCVAASSTQSLSLTNAGNLDHNLTVQGSDLSIDLAPGEEEETSEIGEFIRAGTHRFFCRFHEDQGMVVTLVVE